jgi:5-methyltetrahydropteroyltriglutamate--homocysteine methyltransferase
MLRTRHPFARTRSEVCCGPLNSRKRAPNIKAAQSPPNEGCRYLQLDDTPFAYFCDVDQRKMLADRGDDPDQMSRSYAQMINTAISDIPADMRITMHLCRGNFKSLWIGQGGYAPVAELLFNGVNVNAYFMEYDTERASGFEPLRFVPKDKTVVLGLVTSKTGELESKDELKRRIDEAANSSISISYASVHNADLPVRKKATC